MCSSDAKSARFYINQNNMPVVLLRLLVVWKFSMLAYSLLVKNVRMKKDALSILTITFFPRVGASILPWNLIF